MKRAYMTIYSLGLSNHGKNLTYPESLLSINLLACQSKVNNHYIMNITFKFFYAILSILFPKVKCYCTELKLDALVPFPAGQFTY